MGSKKKTQVSSKTIVKKTTQKKKQKESTPPLPESVTTKKTHRRKRASSLTSWKIPFSRLCKTNKIFTLTRDANTISESALNSMLKDWTKYTRTMQNNNKILSVRNTKQSLVGFLQSRNVEPKVIKELIKAGDEAIKKMTTTE
jgi:hypothetical protein